jgi:hypothetical protein
LQIFLQAKSEINAIKDDPMSPTLCQDALAEPGAAREQRIALGALDAQAGIPSVLRTSRREDLLEQLMQEFEPVGPTEIILVGSLARHTAGIERWDDGGGAVERQAARRLPELIDDSTPGVTSDAVLAAALTTDSAERCEKQSLLRSRLFLRTLEALQSLQAKRRERTLRDSLPPFDFADEAACEKYLMERFRRGCTACPRCGCTKGFVIASRKCWECHACRMQLGLRTGTVMAQSAVPLLIWFRGVHRLLWQPAIRIAEFAEKVGLRRRATARSMVTKIRAAMAGESAGNQLAGLDRHFDQDVGP